ncbi:MAG: CPBP family intramembrane glutamic endopeptidase [Vulcanimicrobiaceae bacterium]
MMRLFKGRGGVRAGWRFLAYLVLLAALAAGVGRLEFWFVMTLHLRDDLAPVPLLLDELTLLIPVLVATLVMAWFERRSVLSYGFTPSRTAAVPRLIEGAVLGAILTAIVAALMLLFGGMRIESFGLHGWGWIAYPLGWAAVMLLVGFTEEAMFRGYPLIALARGIGFLPASLVVTLLFGAAHLGKAGENAIDIGNIMLLALVICFSFWRTGSLWLAVGFHSAFDFMQFFVIGTRNGSQVPVGTLLHATFPGPAWVNGGPLGTEASIFVLPLTLALFLYIAWRHPHRRLALD